ncbi:TraB/GumN family protein [Akkermansiaceae bacterium]|nr:TraB/GumN family protein [Akkermansiaceae bacterium]
MKRSIRCAAYSLASIALLGGQGFAQEQKHPLKPLLWKIEGKGLETPSYLFGTIHLGSEQVTTLHPEARKAFDSADALYTEVPFDVASQLAAAPMMMRKDGKTLAESIGKELSDRLDEELKLINPALDSTPFQPMATWLVGMSLPLLPDQMAGKKALDMQLWEQAAEAGKKTGALETLAGQLGIFAELTEKEQVALLSETMRMLKKDRDAGRNSVAELTAAYVSGDVAKVEAEMQRAMRELAESEHRELGERLMKRLIADRDVIMAATIAEILAKEPGSVHFFAAGAGHFCSKTSIRSHLEKAGYTITRIGG